MHNDIFSFFFLFSSFQRFGLERLHLVKSEELRDVSTRREVVLGAVAFALGASPAPAPSEAALARALEALNYQLSTRSLTSLSLFLSSPLQSMRVAAAQASKGASEVTSLTLLSPPSVTAAVSDALG